MLLLLSFIVFATATANADAAAVTTSFIREKYLNELYQQQYCYTLQEIQHHQDICPEFHTSAMYFAITGMRQLNRITENCRYISAVTPLPPFSKEHYNNNSIVLDITLFHFFNEFVCYTFNYSMILMSVILASCSTLFMIMLLFCQY